MARGDVDPVFGPIVVASDIEDAVTATLQKWFARYLKEIARLQGVSPEFVPRPDKRNYITRNSFDVQEGEEGPRVVVISPGLTGNPTKTSQYYKATWDVGVGVAVSARTEDDVRRKAEMYGAAVRAIISHKRNMTEFLQIENVVWVNERYPDLPIDHPHNLFKAANLQFAITVGNVIKRSGGPLSPTGTEVWPTIPDIEHIHIGLINEGERGDV